MRFIKRFSLMVGGFVLSAAVGITGAVLLVVGVIFVLDRIEAAQVDRFYASRPMLRAMRDALAQHGQPGNLTPILFANVPAGSSQADAIVILSKEGLSCSPVNASQRRLVCDARDRPAPVFRWHIEMAFDEQDKLTDARVLALKATG